MEHKEAGLKSEKGKGTKHNEYITQICGLLVSSISIVAASRCLDGLDDSSVCQLFDSSFFKFSEQSS
jgi:hypothetical protein